MTQLTNDSQTNIELVRPLCYASFTDNKLLAELTFVQAILEGGLRSSPPSQLALIYNNLFGIKGMGTGKLVDGKMRSKVLLPTHEFYHGEMQEIHDTFAVNANIEDSIEQHKALFKLPRYADLWIATTFEDIAEWVQDDGYATSPTYPQELIDVYNDYVR